ncbi:MAG: TatD family hydrolase [Micavibrio sp.]|nr:TatD family hydrolase [Micavibrio sp.]
MWIDSHCHLNHPKFDGLPPADIANQALGQGVDGMVSICCRISEELPQLLDIAALDDRIWCSIGTHPHDAGIEAEQAISEEELIRLAQSSPKIVGIGESGLDYFYDNSPRDLQEQSFRKHIRACKETGLPLIVHTRDAEEDTRRIMDEENKDGKLKAVMHCFSSAPWLADWALEQGFYISFSGIVTFKKSTELQEVARRVPADRILVETDAPFLAPMPNRGKTNHPEMVALTGEFVANLRDEKVKTFAKQTSENFFRLFDKAAA